MRFTVHKDPAMTSELETIYSKLDTIYNTMQPKSHDYFTGIPDPQNVPEKGIVLALVEGNFKIYTKINGVLKSVTVS